MRRNLHHPIPRLPSNNNWKALLSRDATVGPAVIHPLALLNPVGSRVQVVSQSQPVNRPLVVNQDQTANRLPVVNQGHPASRSQEQLKRQGLP